MVSCGDDTVRIQVQCCCTTTTKHSGATEFHCSVVIFESNDLLVVAKHKVTMLSGDSLGEWG